MPNKKIQYRISSVIRQSFFLPKQSQRSRSVLQDGSRSLGSIRKGKIGIIAKFYRTNLFICNHSRGTQNPSYSRINTVDETLMFRVNVSDQVIVLIICLLCTFSSKEIPFLKNLLPEDQTLLLKNLPSLRREANMVD